jgi:hypothetical protein
MGNMPVWFSGKPPRNHCGNPCSRPWLGGIKAEARRDPRMPNSAYVSSHAPYERVTLLPASRAVVPAAVFDDRIILEIWAWRALSCHLYKPA